MSDQSSERPFALSEETAKELMRSLLQKEGTWIDWGKACQTLQKAGYSPQVLFEETGFQGSQQNLIIVASQVYDSLAQAEINDEMLQFFQGPKSDVLYEFRILNQPQRVEAAKLSYEKKLDVDSAKEVARAIKEFSRFSQLPDGFTAHPGDAVAYQCWHQGRQKKDLQARSRLIAKGLKFAHSKGAREAIEHLLTDFTVIPSRKAPLLPIYRLEAEEELARIIPVAGTLPLSRQQVESVANCQIIEPFRLIEVNSPMTVVPLPGWQAILQAQDPVVILGKSDQLPQFPSSQVEEVLVVVDRAVTEWDANFYYLVEQDEGVGFQWFEDSPHLTILGQIILVLRPKRILDENNLLEPWQMDD